jgi:hypothetical protein
MILSDGLGPYSYPGFQVYRMDIPHLINFGTKYKGCYQLTISTYFNTLDTMSGFDRVMFSVKTLDFSLLEDVIVLT